MIRFQQQKQKYEPIPSSSNKSARITDWIFDPNRRRRSYRRITLVCGKLDQSCPTYGKSCTRHYRPDLGDNLGESTVRTGNMKLRLEACRYLIAASIICGAFAVAPIGPTGCAQYNPPALTVQSTDQIILRAEQLAQTARLTFDTFVHLERNNEAILKQASPKIHEYANTIRRNGLNWVDSLRAATRNFKANRNAENQATLNTAIATVSEAVAETNKYIAEAKKVGQP